MKQQYIVEAVLSAKDSGFSAAFKDANVQLDKIDENTKTAADSSGKFQNKLKDYLPQISILAGIAAGFKLISNSVGDALNRIDAMDNFTRKIELMTGSSEKASLALEEVNSTVKGTAYGLDTASAVVGGFVTAGMEVDEATEAFKGWTDAVSVYGDGSNDTLNRIGNAISKMTTKGKVSLEELNVVTEAGIPAIKMYAEATGQSTEEVYDSISKGSIKTEEFLDVMDRAFKEGTTSFKSIAGESKKAGQTWKGTLDNAQAAITRGVTTIIQEFDRGREEAGLDTSKEMIINGARAVEEALTNIGKVAGAVAPYVGDFAQALVTLFIAYKGYQVAQKATDAIRAFGEQNLIAGQSVSVGQALLLVYQGRLTATGAASMVATSGVQAFSAAIKANPIGAAIAGITIAISLLSKLNNVLGGVTKEHQEANDAASQQAASLDALGSASETATKNFDINSETLKMNADHARGVVDSMNEISDSSMSAAEKSQRLEAAANELNNIYPDLKVSINKTTGEIEGGTDALYDQIDAMEEAAKTQAQQDYLTELYKSQIQLQTEIDASNEKLKEMEEQGTHVEAVFLGLGEKSSEGYEELSTAVEQANADLEANSELINQVSEDLDIQSEKQLQAQMAADEQARSLESLNTNYGLTSDAIVEYAETQDMALEEAGTKVLELSNTFGITTDQIVADAQAQGLSLQDLEKEYERLVQEDEKLQIFAQNFNISSESIRASAEAQGISVTELAQAYQSSLGAAVDAINNYVEEGINGFKLIEQEQALSFDQVIANMEENALAMANWSENIATLISLGVNEGVIAELQKMGPAGAEQTQVLVDALSGADSEENLARINGAYGELTDQAVLATTNEEKLLQLQMAGEGQTQAYAQGIINGRYGVETAGTETSAAGARAIENGVITSSGQVLTAGGNQAKQYEEGVNSGASSNTYSELVNSTQPAFDQIETGANVSSAAVAQTIDSGTADASLYATTNTSEMAANTGENFQEVADESARGMTDMNTAVNENLAKTQTDMQESYRLMLIDAMSAFTGIESTTEDHMGKAESAVRSALRGMVSAARGSYSSMRSAGYNAGAGFNSGLSSTRGMIMNTAYSIGRSAASAINSALDIRSPSRVTRKSGQNTGSGLILGMEDMVNKIMETAGGIGQAVGDVLSPSADINLGMYGRSYQSVVPSRGNTVIRLVFGTHEYDTIIDDITRSQDANLELRTAYGNV